MHICIYRIYIVRSRYINGLDLALELTPPTGGDTDRTGGKRTETIQTIALASAGVVVLVWLVVHCSCTKCANAMRRLCLKLRKGSDKRRGGPASASMHREERLRKERLKDITSGVLRVVDKETDTRNRRPRTRRFEDDGYSRLDGNEFLACRTQVQLRRMQEDVQPAGYKLAFLKVCALIASTVSVALGSFDLDLFIAASTALVSFFTTAQENGGYKQEVQVRSPKLTVAFSQSSYRLMTYRVVGTSTHTSASRS